MAHNNKQGQHARMAYKMVKRQAVDDEETTSATGRQPLLTSTDSAVSLAQGRGSAVSTATSSSAERTSTTRRTTARASTTSTDDEDEETSSTDSSSSTRSTSSTSTSSSSSTTRLAPARTTSSPTTTSAGRSTTSSASSTSASGISDTTSGNDTNSSTSGGSKSNAGAIAGAIIAVLVVLAIAAFFGWRYYKKKKNARNGLGSSGGPDGFYPYGSGGASSAALAGDKNGPNNGGYNQRINSFEDLASNAAAANGYGSNGEKYPAYGTMMAGQGNGDDNEKEFGSINRQRSAEQENFAGRGLSPYNSFNSFSNLPPNAIAGLRSPPMGSQSNDSYPPTPQQQAHYSQVGSIYSNGAPNAAMMGHHPQDPFNQGGNGMYGNGDHLPSHQDRALSNAMDAYGSQNGLNNNGMLAGAALGAGAGAGALAAGAMNNNDGQQQGPFADPATEGKTYIVTRTFEPSMPDELVIYPGDKIQIVVPYDDGWCLGCNLSAAMREGQQPNANAAPRGVFPRDCVEEWTEELDAMMNGIPLSEQQQQQQQQQGLPTVMEENGQDGNRPISTNSDIPINNDQSVNLQRAPTLPPLDIGTDNSRFSMTSNNGNGNNNNNKRMSHISNTNRPASLIPGQNVPLPASIKSPVSARAIPLPLEEAGENEEMDIYGGVSEDVTSPVGKSFPPDIQVSSTAPTANKSTEGANATNDKRDSVPQFGSSYHIADYASRIGDEDEASPNNANDKRLSVLDEEASNAATSVNGDEFPSTPRTISQATASPRFSGVPPLSATGIPKSPASSSNARLSIAGSTMTNNNDKNRLSVAAPSVKSVKRTSSLIASKDAETFLASPSPTRVEPENRIA